MKEKWTPHIIAVMALVVFIVLGLACASAPEYLEMPPEKITYNYQHMSFEGYQFVTETRLSPNFNVFGIESLVLLDTADRVSASIENLKESILEERIETNKVYKVYFTNRRMRFSIDRIDGLMPIEEAQARINKKNIEKLAADEAQRQAEEAAEEAQRQAREAANKYDKSKFIIVPETFYPANYTKADLFEAVATSEKLGSTPDIIFNQYVYPSKDFVSDVIFVSQNGTDITFRTADNAISKRMKVDSRTGLTAGQKVRIYYEAYRIKDWHVDAIERL
jgi:hypothetical protein